MIYVSRALSLNIVCMILALPLVLLLLRSPDGNIAGPEIWGLFASAVIYALIAGTIQPKLIYDGALKIGVRPSALRFAFLSLALIFISVPLFDGGSQIRSISGLGILIISAVAYIMALRSVLHVEL